MRILLLRHASVPGSQEGRYLGRTDLSLSDSGRREAEAAGSLEEVRQVYTSSLLRTRETARIFFPQARLIPVPGLSEMDFGDFEGKTAREMEDDLRYREWLDGFCQGACPGGEDLFSFQKRVEEAFRTLVDEAIEQDESLLALVAHGGSIRVIMHAFADPAKAFFDWRVPLAQGFHIYLDREQWERESLFAAYSPLKNLSSLSCP